MSEMDNMMSDNAIETERLGRLMGLSARSRLNLIGSAFAVWERAHPDRRATDALGCGSEQEWRLAVTPRPTGAEFVKRAMELADEFGVKPLVLVNMLRFAESAAAFSASANDGEMLMAALDREQDDGGGTDQ